MTTISDGSAGCGLLEFQGDQSIFEIGGVRVGGQPGADPTVLIGSVFYHGHNVYTDEAKAEIDADFATKVIREQDRFSKLTGNPCMLDVVGATPQAIEKLLPLAAEVTKAPLLIDGTTADVRLAGLEAAAKAGITERIVYNSIQPEIKDDELTAIRNAGVDSAVLLTYYMQDFTGKGRVQCVREMLPRLREAGVHKLLVDTCVLDLATMGQACSAMFDVKNEFGLPVGGGVHNAVATWRGLKSKMGKEAEAPCTASALAMSVGVGADFLMYGPVEDAKIAFPAIAMCDTMLSQMVIERGGKLAEGHPRTKIG